MAFTNPRHRLGTMMFGFALMLSWTLPTTGIAFVIWTERAGSLVRMATWISLWTFTVLAPTLSAMTIHRALARVAGEVPRQERALDDLARLRPFLLLSANMALISAWALIFGR
jgi:hypothetical protein